MNESGQSVLRTAGEAIDELDTALTRLEVINSLSRFLELFKDYLLELDPPAWQLRAAIDAAHRTDRLSALTSKPTTCWRSLARQGLPTRY